MLPLLPLVPLALEIAGAFAPSLVSWIAGDDAGDTATKVIDVAKKVAGVEKPEDVLDTLRSKPELIVELQRDLNALEVGIWQEETKRLQSINETMRAEYLSADPYARRWRPTWGYVTAGAWGIEAVAIVCAVIGATALAFKGQADHSKFLLEGVANLVSAMALAWSVALAVLGVQIQARSNEKIGNTSTGLVGVVKSMLLGKK